MSYDYHNNWVPDAITEPTELQELMYEQYKEEQAMSNNKEENQMFRHGEIVLKPSTKIGKGKSETTKSYIVGHSETGHHHVLESTKPYVVTKDKLGKLWLKLEAEAQLIHQKQTDVHDTLTIPAGIYEVDQKTEYNPFTRSIEAVRD